MSKQSEECQNHFPNNFDFWIGEWQADWNFVNDLSDQQKISRSIHKVYTIFDGKILIEIAEDTGEIENSPIIVGFSMRYYNHHQKKWIMIQSWPNKEISKISQLKGNFDHRRCVMEGNFTREEDNYLQKYTFSDISDQYFRWDKQISKDGIWWKQLLITHFTRVKDLTVKTQSDHNLLSFRNGDLNKNYYEIGSNFIPKGKWNGLFSNENENDIPSSMNVYNLVGGLAQLIIIERDHYKELYFLNYSSHNKNYELISIDNQDGTQHHKYESRSINDLKFKPSRINNEETKSSITFNFHDGEFTIRIVNRDKMIGKYVFTR